MDVDVNQTRFQFESSKEILLQTILNNRENLDAQTIAVAIKDFVKNHEKYDSEKKRILDFISNVNNLEPENQTSVVSNLV